MPSLCLSLTMPDGSHRSLPIVRALTSVGRSIDNAIAIDHPSVPDCAFQIEREGSGALALTALVSAKTALPRLNGKPCERTRLRVGDRIELGDIALVLEELAEPISPIARPSSEVTATIAQDALATLLNFSEAMLGDYRLAPLLDLMMDQVIALTRADRGFLLLLEDGIPSVKVARNPRRENLTDAATLLSDSIVKRVLQTRQPQLVHDALSDPDFSQSASVINLKFLSVLCAPLVEKGEVLG
ncbi:MAG: GAF domain-containing protein, partial [Myxococcales bacterium]|nr:GAF domain-containing protein [Myxococcales bacterium]